MADSPGKPDGQPGHHSPAYDGICRQTAGVVSLAGTQTGHLMCDLETSHAPDGKTPGQLAHDAFWGTSQAWDSISPPTRDQWDKAAAAVLASLHWDETDQIAWTRRGKAIRHGQPD